MVAVGFAVGEAVGAAVGGVVPAVGATVGADVGRTVGVDVLVPVGAPDPSVVGEVGSAGPARGALGGDAVALTTAGKRPESSRLRL